MSETPTACLADVQGATAIEYALIAALISIVIAGTTTTIGQEVLSLFQSFVGQF
jgi:Flp pilus assembly pilin Flp